MKFVYKILLVVIIIVALFLGFYEKRIEEQREPIGATLNTQDEFSSYQSQTVFIKGEPYEVYIADTDQLRAMGLSGKYRLPQGRGMMFTFPVAGIFSFWMKDMKFPLDILWIRDGKIVELWEDAPIPGGGEIPSYTPRETADAVLEFPAGFVNENNILVGDLVR